MKTVILLWLLITTCSLRAQQAIRVGAKHFNEGYILGEMIAIVLEDEGYPIERKFNLGGTTVSFEALRHGTIDVYPEYTGTIEKEILKEESNLSLEQLRSRIDAEFELELSEPYGFNNTYALLIHPALKQQLGITTISDLNKHPDLHVGLSYEFIDRIDGWNNLSEFYNLPQKVVAMEHGLAYQAIFKNEIDVTDAYSTDGEIYKYNLILLDDDRHFFPAYHAVSFYAKSLPSRAKERLATLTGILTQREMQHLNSMALFEDKSHYEIAHTFLLQRGLISSGRSNNSSVVTDILEKTWRHIELTFLALIAAIFVAVPLGIMIFRSAKISRVILYITGILQTIPSIALLALMIPFFGIGIIPAVIALFAYALLPILRNTVIGLATVDPILKKVADAIGLSPWNSLRLVEIPLAVPTILVGIRTAAVINVGTATLAAFIGAGGLGEFIVTGLALNNTNMILMGALPAAALAILTELAFEVVEKFTIPKHLKQKHLL